MRIRIGHTLVYKDLDLSTCYGVGVVTAVTDAEYTILWSRRGSKKYRRSILDERLEAIFKREEKEAEPPKERNVVLGASKAAIPFNENYDRQRLTSLCQQLKTSKSRTAKTVAEAVTAEFVTGKPSLRAATKSVLKNLAKLCNKAAADSASDPARKISQELFFGYVLQESDLKQ